MSRSFYSKPLLDLLRSMTQNRQYLLRGEDGKLFREIFGYEGENPWLHANAEHPENPTQGDCSLWNDLFWETLSRQTMVHTNCAGTCLEEGCFKVVLRPRNIVELMATYDWQQQEPWPCKCGVETRGDDWASDLHLPAKRLPVNALYGAYWYNKGLDAGRERYDYVKAWATEAFAELEYPVTGLKPEGEPHVILKKGCTEFERTVGPSDTWHKLTHTMEHQVLMQLLERYVDWEPEYPESHDLVHHQTLTRWLQWAYGHGDKTYLELTNGHDLYPGYVTYHDRPDVPMPWLEQELEDQGK